MASFGASIIWSLFHQTQLNKHTKVHFLFEIIYINIIFKKMLPIDELAAIRALLPSSMNFVMAATSTEPPKSKK